MTDNILTCEFVTKEINGTRMISSEDREKFIKEYRFALEETKGLNAVVYVFKSEKPVPRLKESSNILYIGQTQNDAWNRINVKDDTERFWNVYNHTLKNHGKIYINIYISSDHKKTEKNFLTQYFKYHLELPPFNRQG
jgi:hypothetical protein